MTRTSGPPPLRYVGIAIPVFESLGIEFTGGDWTVFENMFEHGIPMEDLGTLLAQFGAAIVALVVLFIFTILVVMAVVSFLIRTG